MGNNNRQSNQTAGKANLKSGYWVIGAIAFIIFATVTATENYSEGERIGFITKFSSKGRIWKSWEGELNLT